MSIAVVTGASGGIGAEIAKQLAQDGFSVALIYNRNAEKAQKTADEITLSGGSAKTYKCDVRDNSEITSAIEAIERDFGEISVLVNNAGISEQKLLTDITDSDWENMISTNLSGAFYFCRAVLPYFVHRKSGRIINISSMWGETGGSCEVHYSAAKAGIIGLTKALAKEVATEAAEKFGQPFFLYEDSAKGLKHSANLATIRKGQFEGMAEKIAADPETWTPDIGPSTIHPTGGATVIGARMPLIAYNINLSTSSVEIAQKIADKIRNIKGGFKYCKAMGVLLENKEDPSKNVAQVSMNLTNYTKTSIYTVFETVRMEARRYGVNVMGSEIIGLVPLQALVDCAAYYLGLNNLEESNCGFETKFTTDQVLETRL